jgi:LPXTG-motif cell wall-anchored protein
MIDISGRAVRAGIRGFTAVATASCFVVTPQVTNIASAHTGERAARAHDHTTPRPDHEGREARDHGRGRADVVVNTRGPKGVIVPGRTYEWPFEVTNRGSEPAEDVSLTARPNRNLKVLAAPPKCRWRNSGPLVCDIGLLPQGHTKRGVITATIVPRTHSGKALTNPIQVSWRNTPSRERLMAEFPPVEVPPVEVSPGTGDTSAVPAADGKVPYPLMVTEHGPVTAESVVVRSPIGLPAPEGPCAAGVAPGKIADKPAAGRELGPCGAQQDDPAACGCSAAHEAPAASVPDVADVPQVTAPDRPAAAPCGAVARPVVIPDRPLVPPCAQQRPVAPPPAAVERPAGEPAAPCGVVPDRPMVPPCAKTGPAAWVDEPAAAACGVFPARPASAEDRPALPPCARHEPVAAPPAAEDRPATPACHAAVDRPVILPAPIGVPAAVPGSPCGAAPDRPATVKADQPADTTPVDTRPVATTPVDTRPAGKPADKTADKPTGKPVEKPADAGDDKAAGVPAAAPCGASAAGPGAVPGRPVIIPRVPAIPPCAHGRPDACGCLASANAPAEPAAEPVVPAVPVVPATPGTAPCPAGAADQPMANDKATPERPLGPSCGHGVPAAVHEEPAATPDTIEPMTPLTGPGKAADQPLGRPHHHVPLGRPHHHVPLGGPHDHVPAGRPHHGCVRQGTGFVCPLGSAAHHRPPVVNLHSPAHPRALRCVGASSAGCHTREARPVAVRPQPARGNLPTTGSSSALLALSGLGLAGAGVVLYRLSRTRTRREEG